MNVLLFSSVVLCWIPPVVVVCARKSSPYPSPGVASECDQRLPSIWSPCSAEHHCNRDMC